MFRLEQIIPATGPNPPWLVGERRKPSDGTPSSEEGAPPLAGGQNPITPQSMALVSSVPFHLKNLISMYDYFQVKTNGTPRKCWCIVFSCKKRLKISIFVYFAPCWPYQTSTFPQEVQEHVQRCGEAASNSRHGCVSA